MHVLVRLLILSHLGFFDDSDRKAGVFPLVVLLHEELDEEVAVVVLEPPTAEERKNFSEHTNSGLISPPSRSLSQKIMRESRRLLRRALGITQNPLEEEVAPALQEVQKAVKGGLQISAVGALRGSQRTGALALKISKQFDVPYWVWEHATNFARGFSTNAVSEAVREIVRGAKVVAAVSPGLENLIHKHVWDATVSTVTLPPALGSNHFEPVKRSEVVNTFAKDRFVFGSWTNWREFKRLDLLLDALKLAVAENQKICLVVGGPVPTWTLQMVAERALERHVLLTGPLDRKQIKELCYSIDCVVVPSDHETFGLPVIEAFAAGKPALVTRSGGPEYSVTSSELGMVVRRGSAADLSSAMVRIAVNNLGYNPEAIIEHCKLHFGSAAFKNKLSDIYRLVEN